MIILSTNIDKKSLETEFLIAICRPTGDKCQSKTLFLAIFDPHSSIVKSVFDCRLSGVSIVFFTFQENEKLKKLQGPRNPLQEKQIQQQ